MTSRTWLAIVLCCLVWFVYMRWFAPTPPPHPPAETPTAASSNTGKPPAEAQGTGISLLNGQVAVAESHKIETPKTTVVFSEVGGKIQSIQLKDYTETIQKDSPGIFTIAPSLSHNTLGTFFTQSQLAPLSGAKYAQKVEGNTIQFTGSNGGVTLKKTYQLTEDPYFMQATYVLHFPEGAAKDQGYLLVPVGAQTVQYDANTPLSSWEAVMYQNEEVKRETWENLPPQPEIHQGNTGWVAFGNRYFATSVVNRSEINPDVIFSKSADLTGVYLRYPIVLKEGQRDVTYKVDIFSGPKDYASLDKVPGMKQLIDYGTFSFFAYPLLELLRFFYKFVHNYGVAIILLTLVVRVVFYPLSVKSYRSMKAMQKLQPQITALKEKYKDDPQRFGQEQMALFRAHKVNPAGGCLPMLVQLPVFIALYAVLGNSIELFHAPFFGWVQDLSSKDPYYIYPVLMGISMLAQQKMTPAAGMDPTQQKVMLLMPVVFTFIMLNLPSGLTMYIFLSTILGVLQQMLINREGKTATPGLVTSPQGGAK